MPSCSAARSRRRPLEALPTAERAARPCGTQVPPCAKGAEQLRACRRARARRRAQIELHTRPGALRVAVVTEAAEALPAAELAWRHDVVLTTFSYLSCAWGGARAAAGGAGAGAGPCAAAAPARASPLVHVHWLRLILDEGHMLGASLQLTNKLQAGPRAALRRARRRCPGVAWLLRLACAALCK